MDSSICELVSEEPFLRALSGQDLKNQSAFKDRNIDQWNKTESPKIHPPIYGHLILTKEARIYNGEKTISLTSGAEKTGQLLVR